MVQTFWTEIQNYLQRKLSKSIVFTLQTISFCNVLIKSDEDSLIINYITLLAKYFIFKNKCNKSVPTLEAFKNYLLERKKIEENIAFFKGKVNFCATKWQKIVKY